MPLRPDDWNVVVLGRWNPALFTPAGISTRIFGLPEGTPIEVYVSIDDVAPPRVKHGGITVSASFAQLNVAIDRCSFAELDRARATASAAIEQLPRTPVTACGFNLRFKADALPAPLAQRFSQDLDQRFSDLEYQILGRQLHRRLAFQNGRLLVMVTAEPDESAEVLFNFEMLSKDQSILREWLAVPIDTIKEAISRILRDALQLTEADYVSEQHEHDGPR